MFKTSSTKNAYETGGYFFRVRPQPTVPVSRRFDGTRLGEIDQFRRYLNAWKDSVAVASSIQEMVQDPSFISIVEMGRVALPLIKAELEREPSFLFLAAQQITEQNPVSPEKWGDVGAMSEQWVNWLENTLIDAN